MSLEKAIEMPRYSPAVEEFVRRFQLQLPASAPAKVTGKRQAAVLIPIICREQPTLLLTRRSDSLRKHAGQVAFPGGAVDASDSSIIFTALREAQEEVAIPHGDVNVLGTLAPLDSSTGFQVTPVVGLLPVDVPLHPCEDEVAELFEMPLEEAFNLSRYHPLDIHRAGTHHRVYLSWYQQQFVWGLTAAIIRRLAEQIRA
ncbi:8-oxo-dGTP pyrophosphatase MutT (NUDIX family) [Ewingella americana]|jgi:8-oxo-dGTP pyrophosphatase MutT (NUDIX family)|uniref:CoA pyrophosphatase n=1 Tax=Ewingella americana TaxID=41202 RepID=UPI0012AE377F|nr:CoA pyrophosphatase [Ewingella americana]MRT05015.1 CoA pyrophosphatase [Ewingella americana]